MQAPRQILIEGRQVHPARNTLPEQLHAMVTRYMWCIPLRQHPNPWHRTEQQQVSAGWPCHSSAACEIIHEAKRSNKSPGGGRHALALVGSSSTHIHYSLAPLHMSPPVSSTSNLVEVLICKPFSRLRTPPFLGGTLSIYEVVTAVSLFWSHPMLHLRWFKVWLIGMSLLIQNITWHLQRHVIEGWRKQLACPSQESLPVRWWKDWLRQVLQWRLRLWRKHSMLESLGSLLLWG
jgi:hypothetical protein